MNSTGHAGPLVAALAVIALLAAAPAPAAGMQILAAADDAELTAVVSGRAVSRIALMDDRIARVIRAPDGFAVEHDPAMGDLYLRPPDAGGADGMKTMPDRPVTLFLGTEKGFTYRLTLAVRDRGSAQILIRDPAARTAETGAVPASDARIGSHGFVLELPPFAGIDEETLGALSGTLADAAPEHCTIQAIHWASPRFGAPLAAWAEARAEKSGARATMARCRREMFAHAGWRPLHEGGPPYTLSDYRVFVTACLSGAPGPASETALGGFRRALEGTLASAGATARRLEPDALLSLAAELAAPVIPGARGPDSGEGGTERPRRRWSPRDPIHMQCAAPGRALSVSPAGLVFHDPDGSDVAVRVLSALAFPEVWPGWRGKRHFRSRTPRASHCGAAGGRTGVVNRVLLSREVFPVRDRPDRFGRSSINQPIAVSRYSTTIY